MSDSLRPHGQQHASPPCPSRTPRVAHLPKLMCIELVMPFNHLVLCHPLLLLPSIFPSIRVFSKESVLHIRWPKYWSFFSFSISLANEFSGLISFRIDWFDLLAVSQVFSNTTVQKHQFFSVREVLIPLTPTLPCHLWKRRLRSGKGVQVRGDVSVCDRVGVTTSP